MRISVELIPRSHEDFAGQLDELQGLGPVDTVNVPDIIRFPLRSYAACASVTARGLRAVPHLRAVDVDPTRSLPFLAALDDAGVDEVLVIAGDAPADMSRPVYDTTSETLIRRIKAQRPTWSVYAALDPYRQGFAAEREYLVRKLDAGADGVFTQPFFDVRLAKIWGDVLSHLGTTVFWGATSVTSPRSARYWTTRNRALLPNRFRPTLEHSREVARELLAFARERDENVYFMPIRASAQAYLGDLL